MAGALIRPACSVTIQIGDNPATATYTTPKLRSLTLTEPSGVAGAGFTAVFAATDVSLPDELDGVVVQVGYYDASGVLRGWERFDEEDLQREKDFRIERLGDTLVLRCQDRLERLKAVAPSDFVYYGDNSIEEPLNLHAAVAWLCDKLGLRAIIQGLPDFDIERFEITPYQTYWSHVERLVMPFEPVIAPDMPSGRILFGAETDMANVGLATGKTIELTEIEAQAKPEQPYPIVTQVDVRYLGAGGDGDALTYGCGIASESGTLERPGGARVVATSDACGNAQLSGAQVLALLGPTRCVETTEVNRELLWPDSVEPEDFTTDPAFLDLAPVNSTTITYTIKYLNFLDQNGDVERSVEHETVQKQWGTAGEFLSSLVSETTTKYFFLPQSNFEVSTGHETVTHGRVNVPGAGTQFVQDLLVETEQIRFERWNTDGPNEWRKTGAKKLTRGWVLFPSETPLYQANLNGTVDTTSTTTERPRKDVLISQQIERVSQGTLRNQLKTTITVHTYVPNPGVSESYTVDTIGRQQLSGEAEPLTETIVRDDLATTYGGHRARQVIDATSWGPIGLEVGRYISDVWFGRVGTYRKPVTLTIPKVLGWLSRGSIVKAKDRAGNSAQFFVTGITYEFAGLDQPRRDGGAARTIVECLLVDSPATSSADSF